MKNKSVAVFMIVILAISACKKNSNVPGSWNVKGIAFKAATCVNVSSTLTAYDGIGDSLFIVFPGALPTTNGSYAVAPLYSSTLTANQVFVTAIIGATSTYYTGTGTGSVGITVSGGKVSAVNTTVIGMINPNPPATDTTSITFRVNQQ